MNKVKYLGEVHGGPSNALWGDFPFDGDPADYFGFFDDFSKGGLITSPTTSAALVGLPYSGFGDTGSTITYANALGGGIKLLSDGTDNDATSVFSLSHCFQMGLSNQPLWFEAKLTFDALLTTETGFFLGLADSTAKTSAVPLTDTASALADLNLVGLHSLDTDLAVVKSCYKSNGVDAVDVQSIAGARVEGTAVKLGFKKDRRGIVRWFVNGVEQSSTFQVIDDLGTGFPGDALLAPCLSMAVGAATGAQTVVMNWWGCYQLRA